jgi:hypothetical protein
LCPQCAAEVDGQRQARSALRDSRPIDIPTSLLGTLSQIPHQSDDALGEPAAPAADDSGMPRGRRKRR